MFIKLNDVRYNTDRIIAYGIEDRTNRFYLLFDDNHIHYLDGEPKPHLNMMDKLLKQESAGHKPKEVVYGFNTNSYI